MTILTFALCGRLQRFSVPCCSQRARKGQRRVSSRRRSDFRPLRVCHAIESYYPFVTSELFRQAIANRGTCESMWSLVRRCRKPAQALVQASAQVPVAPARRRARAGTESTSPERPSAVCRFRSRSQPRADSCASCGRRRRRACRTHTAPGVPVRSSRRFGFGSVTLFVSVAILTSSSSESAYNRTRNVGPFSCNAIARSSTPSDSA